jgi:hypothetical protein
MQELLRTQLYKHYQSPCIYVDLGGPDWKVVNVTPSTPLEFAYAHNHAPDDTADPSLNSRTMVSSSGSV